MLDDFLGNNSAIQISSIVMGLAVLTLGRKLFWLVVGVAGFITGLMVVARLMNDQPDGVILVVAIVAGLIGAGLAIVVQKVAVGLAGLLLGGAATISLLDLAGAASEPWSWLVVLIGAGLGLGLALALLEPALVILSALAGAILITQAVNLSPLATLSLFVILLAAGIIIQMKMLVKE